MAAVALLLMSTLTAAQPAGVEPLTAWTAEPGGQALVEAGGVTVRRGTIRTARLYSDFVLRFEFRLAEPNAEGRVFVRARFGYGGIQSKEHGYRVGLTSKRDGIEALGRIVGVDVGMEEREFTPAQGSGIDGSWQAVELRAERRQMTVTINGSLVNSADGLDEFTGYIALQATRGDGIQFRNIIAERFPPAGDPFGRGAYRATEPRLKLPRARKTAKPLYPKEPHDAWIQGVVGLEVVVDTTGRSGDVRVVKSLHPDLDEAAIASARQWEFVPGTLLGQAVPVIVGMEVSFRRTR